MSAAPASGTLVPVKADTVRKIAALIELLLPAYGAAVKKCAAAESVLQQHQQAVEAGVRRLVAGGIVRADGEKVACERLLRPGAMIDHITSTMLTAPEPPVTPIGAAVAAPGATKRAFTTSNDAAYEMNAAYLRSIGMDVTEENLKQLAR